MTRFALCAVTHAIAAKLAEPNLTDEQAGAIGVAIATAIAALKNKRLGNGGKFKGYAAFVRERENFISANKTDWQRLIVGGFEVAVNTSEAIVYLNGEPTKFVGTAKKYDAQISQIDEETLRVLKERLASVAPSSRKVFDVYRQIRDEKQL